MNCSVVNIDDTIKPEHIGQRLLLTYDTRVRFTADSYDEGTPLELSPSGFYVLMEWRNGGQQWLRVDNWRIVEVLPPKPEEPRYLHTGEDGADIYA